MEMSCFFFARYLTAENHWIVPCGFRSEGLVISFLVHGKTRIKIFEQKLRFFIKKLKFKKKILEHEKIF